MKPTNLLLNVLGLAILAAATVPGSNHSTASLASSQTTIYPTTSRTQPNPPRSTIPLIFANQVKRTTVPYTTLLACDTILTTRAACRTVTSNCILPASTTTTFTAFINGTTTSGIVCIPTAHLSTHWAPHKTRTWWTAAAQATETGTVEAAHVPLADWSPTPSPSWSCGGESCMHRASDPTGLAASSRRARVGRVPPPEWMATRFPTGCAQSICNDPTVTRGVGGFPTDM